MRTSPLRARRPAAGHVAGLARRGIAALRVRLRLASAMRHALVDRGTATAEYAIATLAACGFGGVLLALLRSSQVRAMLTGVIKRALTIN